MAAVAPREGGPAGEIRDGGPVQPSHWLTVVGIGEDGYGGLGDAARAAIGAAEVLVGGERHLSLLPDHAGRARRVPWPSPMLPMIDTVLGWRGRSVCVLASGDPMLHGVGATFARRLSRAEMRVIPHVSAFALACARLGWAEDEATLVTVHGRSLDLLHPAVQPGRRLVVYTSDGCGPAAIAQLLVARGYGPSRLSVLEHLGGPLERRIDGPAAGWAHARLADLNTVAIECVAEPSTPVLAAVPGLPDEAFLSDGQLTKREVRAVALARLAPVSGQLLWDVGAGSGSIAIEWMRTHPSCRAIAVERHPERQARILENARRLGVPGLRLIARTAPEALSGLDRPDAIFVGGGMSAPGVLETCWEALLPGGRLVVNAVTVQGEVQLAAWHARLGGDLVRVGIGRAEPVGGFLAWRQMMPVTQWAARKP